ncbi:MAG: Gfo/Idh/MocA family oxidoreductase [Trueperaceae bacterium]|nr:Gfo/Idh/MocA family oxidoreductase [Trueperaceae bacterium]
MQHKDCQLAAIVDPSEAARALAQEKAIPYFDTLEALLAGEQVDGIILATPNQLHLEQGLRCLQAGIMTLIEKPVTNTVAEGLVLLEAERQSKARILVGHHRAHSSIMRTAQALIQKGTLGDVVAITGSALFYKPDHYFQVAPWRTQVGGGPILINSIHDIHNFRMLCGEISEVQAFSSSKTRNFEVEDTVVINFRFENGALGTFALSDTAASAKSWEQTSQENKTYAAYPEENCYHVAGTAGSLDIPSMHLKTYSGEKSWWQAFTETRLELNHSDPLDEQLEHFCQVIRGEATPKVSLKDGLRNLCVVEAILKAAKSGYAVEVAKFI